MADAPIALRGEARVYWQADKVPPGQSWPAGLADYYGHATIGGVRFRVEGWRTENDAGRHVRLTFISQPIPQGQWPQR